MFNITDYFYVQLHPVPLPLEQTRLNEVSQGIEAEQVFPYER